MSDDAPQQHWFFKKWPDWLKVFAAIGTICGCATGLLSIGSAIGGQVKAYNAAVIARAEADKEVLQRNKKIDDVLTFHGQQNWNQEQKLNEIDKKLDKLLLQGKKPQ